VSECSLEERTCPHCGALRPEIGEEVREELEVIPAKVIVNRYIMKKYGPASAKTVRVQSSKHQGQ